MTIRVFLLNGHELVREGLRAVLGREDGIEVVGEADSAVDGLHRIEATRPDVVIADLGLDQAPLDPTTLQPDELIRELQGFVKQLLGYGARLPKELMLFVKNMVFVDAAIGTLAPDLDLFGEVAHIATHFATNHGATIASEIGIDPAGYQVDLTSFKDSLGVDRSTEAVTYEDLRARRELIQQRMRDRDKPSRSVFGRLLGR